jgi:hypothetical protein
VSTFADPDDKHHTTQQPFFLSKHNVTASKVIGHLQKTWTAFHFGSMPLNRLPWHPPLTRLVFRTSIRTASTIVGKSGRVYVQGKVLQRREDQKLSIFKAE